jgi:hypothetical protein
MGNNFDRKSGEYEVLGIPGCRCEDIIKLDLTEIRREGECVDGIHLAQNKVSAAASCENSNKLSCSTKDGTFRQ